jgi:hypothetical protein
MSTRARHLAQLALAMVQAPRVIQPAHALHLLTAAPPDPFAGEERLVREAILMVAAKRSPRVMVAGLVHGEQVLDRCRRVALEAGVRLHPRATARGDRVDIVVEATR